MSNFVTVMPCQKEGGQTGQRKTAQAEKKGRP